MSDKKPDKKSDKKNHPKELEESTIRLAPEAYEQLFQLYVPEKDLFIRHYNILQKHALDTEKGIVVAAFYRGVLENIDHLYQKDECSKMIIGRHQYADMSLKASDLISLRHLLILLYPKTETLQYKIMDLQTPSGFSINYQQAIRAAWSNGIAFIQIPDYQIMIVPKDLKLWMHDAATAWEKLPHRNIQMDITHSESNHEQNESGEASYPLKPSNLNAILQQAENNHFTLLANEDNSDDAGLKNSSIHVDIPTMLPKMLNDSLEEHNFEEETSICSLKPPEWLSTDFEQTKNHQYLLHFITNSSSKPYTLFLNDAILEQGILFGRYQRCNIRIDNEAYHDISRLHCLFIRVANQNYVVDLGSTNGTYVHKKTITIVALHTDTNIALSKSNHHNVIIKWLHQ